MKAVFLVLAVLGISLQAITKKQYNAKSCGKGVFTFGAVSVLVAWLFFLFLSRFKLTFAPEILPYALIFAISYGTATVTGFIALRLGALSLTSLITATSLVIPTLFGIFFYSERISVTFAVGFFLVLLSIVLMNSKKSEVRISLGWAVSVFFAFLGNGVCSATQNAAQRELLGRYKYEFMIISLSVVFLILLISALFAERGEIASHLRCGAHYMAICGIANGAVNLVVMLLATRMPASVMFPVMSAGGIILSSLVSRFVYRERLSPKQLAALFFGITAVVLMNI